jgi:hypothetical protein
MRPYPNIKSSHWGGCVFRRKEEKCEEDNSSEKHRTKEDIAGEWSPNHDLSSASPSQNMNVIGMLTAITHANHSDSTSAIASRLPDTA